MTVHVLIVDDHAIVRQGLRLLLETQSTLEIVGEAVDGATAIQMADTLQPDIILMDLLMPGIDGAEATRRIKLKHPATKILVLTSSLDDHLVQQTVQAGADGYILKASRALDLVQAIGRITEGLSVLDPAVTRIVMHQTRAHDPLRELTGREREVFDLLAHGLNNPDIAKALDITEATVRTHVASVLDKLTLRDRTQVIIFGLKHGLVRLEDLP